jgi:hypothetical protein
MPHGFADACIPTFVLILNDKFASSSSWDMKFCSGLSTGLGVASLTISLACWYSLTVRFLRIGGGATGWALFSLLLALPKLCWLSSWIVGMAGGGLLLLVTL